MENTLAPYKFVNYNSGRKILIEKKGDGLTSKGSHNSPALDLCNSKTEQERRLYLSTQTFIFVSKICSSSHKHESFLSYIWSKDYQKY